MGILRAGLAVVVVASIAPGCGGGDDDDDGGVDRDGGDLDDASGATPADLPLIAPPVREATPAGFQIPMMAGAIAELVPGATAQAFRDRFFSGAGPTDVQRLLTEVDDQLTEINGFALASPRACLDQEPVAYALDPFGQGVEFYAQCYRLGTATEVDPALVQFGKKDGTTYLYVAGGAARLAAKVTPIEGAIDAYAIGIWFGVGYDNPNGSYGVAQLQVDSQASAFEMTAAGTGLGFCGVQLVSDAATIYGVGSNDMGETCLQANEICTLADDLTTEGTCDPPPAFALPALGRLGGDGVGESDYPETPTIVLDATTGSDSLHFGPEAPTAGVGDFDAAP